MNFVRLWFITAFTAQVSSHSFDCPLDLIPINQVGCINPCTERLRQSKSTFDKNAKVCGYVTGAKWVNDIDPIVFCKKTDSIGFVRGSCQCSLRCDCADAKTKCVCTQTSCSCRGSLCKEGKVANNGSVPTVCFGKVEEGNYSRCTCLRPNSCSCSTGCKLLDKGGVQCASLPKDCSCLTTCSPNLSGVDTSVQLTNGSLTIAAYPENINTNTSSSSVNVVVREDTGNISLAVSRTGVSSSVKDVLSQLKAEIGPSKTENSSKNVKVDTKSTSEAGSVSTSTETTSTNQQLTGFSFIVKSHTLAQQEYGFDISQKQSNQVVASDDSIKVNTKPVDSAKQILNDQIAISDSKDPECQGIKCVVGATCQAGKCIVVGCQYCKPFEKCKFDTLTGRNSCYNVNSPVQLCVSCTKDSECSTDQLCQNRLCVSKKTSLSNRCRGSQFKLSTKQPQFSIIFEKK